MTLHLNSDIRQPEHTVYQGFNERGPSAPAPIQDTARSKVLFTLAAPVRPDGRIFLVDSDCIMRDRLVTLISRTGWSCVSFSAGAELMTQCTGSEPSCVILGFSLGDGSGLDLQKRLAKERPNTSVIFHTAGVALEAAVQAMKAGAVDILGWAVDDEATIAAIDRSLARSRFLLDEASRLRIVSERHALLTPREKQIMEMVVSGLLNKQIAFALGRSEITVKAHRGRVMRKMEATSLPELVMMAWQLGLDHARAVRSGAVAATDPYYCGLSKYPGLGADRSAERVA